MSLPFAPRSLYPLIRPAIQPRASRADRPSTPPEDLRCPTF